MILEARCELRRCPNDGVPFVGLLELLAACFASHVFLELKKGKYHVFHSQNIVFGSRVTEVTIGTLNVSQRDLQTNRDAATSNFSKRRLARAPCQIKKKSVHVQRAVMQ